MSSMAGWSQTCLEAGGPRFKSWDLPRSWRGPVQVLRLASKPEGPGPSPETCLQVLRLASKPESPGSSPETCLKAGGPRFKSWDLPWSRRAPVQVLRLLTFWPIAVDKLLTLWCPCSPRSVNCYQLASRFGGLGWDCALMPNSFTRGRVSQGCKAACNLEIC